MDLKALHTPPADGPHLTRRKQKKRVGRGIGSGHGKTSTRGHKGQWASAGAKKPAVMFEGGQMQLFRRMPKRGFSHATWDKYYLPINVEALNEAFKDGDVVDHAALKNAGLANGPADGVRILGEGELARKLTVKAHHFSKSARSKIEGKGGTCEVIAPPAKPKKNKMKPRPSKG